MGPRLTLLTAGICWGLFEAIVLLVNFTYISHGETFGPFSTPDNAVPMSVYLSRIGFMLEISVVILAAIAGYILAEFLEAFKALLVSQAVAIPLSLSGAVLSYSTFTGTVGPFFVYFELAIFLLVYLVAGLGSSLVGALLGTIMDSETPFTTDSRFVSAGLVLSIIATMLTILLPDTPAWIIFPMIPLIIVGTILSLYGQMRVRMLKPRTAGLILILAVISIGLSLGSLTLWNGFYDYCVVRGSCSYQASDLLHIIWVTIATLATPGFVLLGIFFPKDWTDQKVNASPSV